MAKPEPKTPALEIDPIKALLDEKNCEDIVLYDEKDQPVVFQQIALVPLKKKNYAILRPRLAPEWLQEDQAIVFEILKTRLKVVKDDDVIDLVFVEYNKLMDEAEKK